MARNNKTRKGLGRKTFAFVLDGDTEKWYLQMLRQNEDIGAITIKPELGSKVLSEQFADVVDNAAKYDRSIWIIDLDVVLREARESGNGAVFINTFKGYLKKLEAYANVEVLVNTPCLEYWLLMHVADTGRFFAECGTVEKELRKFPVLENYAKTEKYFKTPGNDIYKRLRKLLPVGIENAKKRGNFDVSDMEKGKAEMYRIFEILGIQV
jgi:hypothetical protein